MQILRKGWGGALILGLALAAGAARAEAVDVALVLAADVSRSIDAGEFRLQRQGYAAAITSPRVMAAIQGGTHRAIALCFVEWSGPEEQAVVGQWTVIKDGESASVFAATLIDAPRSFTGRTSISAAIDFALALFAQSGVQAERRIIDVSGDGTNNAGRAVSDARDEAVAQGVTVNGLAIINERPEGYFFAHTQPPEGLPAYYQNNVVGGAGAFMLQVKDFSTFGDAITNKLLTEIAALAPPRRTALR
ncbi:MAG TPA: DUF1194 domain-containing protein [Stellaceae bacterium]|nr:DUF1194 domain-containing protein [Stellaceae bacterium]